MQGDTAEVDMLLDISKGAFRSHPDTAILYADKAITLAREINYESGLGYGLKNKGLGYYIHGEFTEVLNHWKQS